ncbi:MAG: YqgE/AlgH family protein [Bacteroidota bacterium]
MDYFSLNPGSSSAPPQAGKILIAEPLLNDPNFARSVIFLCEHSAEGSIGFILNQPTDYTLQDLLPELYVSHLNIYQGGPVQGDTLHMLHRMGNIPGSIEVAPGVYWGGSYEALKDMIWRNNYEPNDLRLFVGYSGWGAGQLEREMTEGSWLVADATDGVLFETSPDELWKKAIGLLGKKYAYLTNIPIDPQLN